MSNKTKDIDIKYRTYYSYDNINNKNFDPKNIKTDEKSYKDILIYYIGNETIKCLEYVKIHSFLLYLIFNKVNGFFQEINEHKYLTPVPTNESK